MSALLVADSIGKSFGRRKVLQSAYLDAREGSITLLAGRNGEGKSTLLGVAAGWLAPDHGTVRYAGAVYTRPRLHRLARRGLFFLPDAPLLTGWFTVGQQLEAATRGGDASALRSVVNRLGVADLLDRTPDTLSGGERKRVDLALAIARRPRCLLADEPHRSVDPKDAETVSTVLADLRDAGCAVVVSGHGVSALLELADRVIWVTAGTTRVLGSPAAAMADDHFRREYLTGSWAADPPVAGTAASSSAEVKM